MKKFFLLPLFALLLGNFSLFAQSGCDPDDMLPDSVIVFPLPYQEDFPERGLQDTACAESYFETVIQFNIPSTIPVGGNEVALSAVTVQQNGIVNLPSGFDYVCNPPNCVFPAEESGCIQIFGTAAAEDVGMYDLQISVVVNSIIDLPFTLPDGQLVMGNYFFFVEEAGSANCTIVDNTYEVTENAFDLSIQPNPFSDRAQIAVDLPEGGMYELKVFNVLGTLVQSQQKELVAGQNQFQFDGSNLATGMYVFRLQRGTQAASGRLMIQR